MKIGLPRKWIDRLRDKLAKPPSTVGPHDDWAGQYTLNPLFVELTRQPGCGHMYAWGAMQAARLASALGIRHVSMIEFGVAGGRSLISLEKIAARLEERFEVRIDVFGFDTGRGLPDPVDHRDMPNLWSPGFFAMDVERLRPRLARARLLLGDVKETASLFIASDAAPIAFVSFDVDYYSSTMAAFELFSQSSVLTLPRVHCYFDDVLGYSFGDHVGSRLAIAEFNNRHASRKFSAVYGLRHFVPPAFSHWLWERYFMLHVFDHPLYNTFDGTVDSTACDLPPP